MKKLLAFSILGFAALTANADAAWLQYSIWSPGDLLLPWNRADVYGLRLDMPYANNQGSVYGIDLGLVGVAGGDVIGFETTCVNIADIGAMEGLQIGVLGNRTKQLYGMQIAGVLNWNDDVAYGLQIAPVNYNGEFYGLQLGGVNWFSGNAYGAVLGGFFISHNSFSGFSVGSLNYVLKEMDGFQLGGVNLAAESSCGLQLAAINIAKAHEGFQIGLININVQGIIPCLPLVNFNFTR